MLGEQAQRQELKRRNTREVGAMNEVALRIGVHRTTLIAHIMGVNTKQCSCGTSTDRGTGRRVNQNRAAHEQAGLGCAVGDAVAIARSMENAPAPRTIRNAVIASTSR